MTRVGRSFTPANTARRPIGLPGVAGSTVPVTMPRNASTSASASATDLPFTAAVIIDADALQIAHDWPSKAMPSMRSPSRWTCSQM